MFSYSLKVCQGSYDDTLIKAWEAWDEKNHSENDHPKEFPEKQVAQFSLWLLLVKVV